MHYRKSWKLQVVLVSIALMALFLANVILLAICIENHNIQRSDVLISITFCLCCLIAQSILYHLRDEKLAWDNEEDIANNYADKTL